MLFFYTVVVTQPVLQQVLHPQLLLPPQPKPPQGEHAPKQPPGNPQPKKA